MPTFDVVVFNPFGNLVAIYQLGVTACSAGSCVTKDLPSGEVVLGKNAIESRSMWIALKNVKCATPSNPFAYCAVSIYDTAPTPRPHYYCEMAARAKHRGMNLGPAHVAPPAKRRGMSGGPRTLRAHAPLTLRLPPHRPWADWFREDTQLGAIVAAVAVGVVAGALIGVLCACCGLCAVLHVFGCVVCPCFNCCCDRRKRSVGGAAGVTGFSVPSYPINPAAIGAAYSAQTYATTQQQQQQAKPSSSLTAKWDPSGQHA